MLVLDHHGVGAEVNGFLDLRKTVRFVEKKADGNRSARQRQAQARVVGESFRALPAAIGQEASREPGDDRSVGVGCGVDHCLERLQVPGFAI
jgi:hypothetical protein